MARLSRYIAVIFAIIVLTVIGIVSAQTIPKPSVPEFSLKVVAYPYDVAPTTTIDPYTGKAITTNDGYHEENRSIEITIKNQPFTSSLDKSGNYSNLYYNIRFKGSYEDLWKYYPVDLSNSNYSSASVPINASKSMYTIINLGLSTYQLNNVPVGSKIDVQVEALIGYVKQVNFFFMGSDGHYYTFSDFEESGWSTTQTLTIGESSNTINPTSSPEPTPTVLEFPNLTAIPLLLSALAVALALRIKKSKPKNML